ncbi:Hypothetical predicted protein, partial [Pelobates cultripes]
MLQDQPSADSSDESFPLTETSDLSEWQKITRRSQVEVQAGGCRITQTAHNLLVSIPGLIK